MRYSKLWMGILGFILSPCSSAWAQDPGWPRQLVKPGGKLIIYPPQVDDWKNFTDIGSANARMPIDAGPVGET
jgi:hypothetical protein